VPAFGPVRRTELLRALRAVGFEGAFSGGKHQPTLTRATSDESFCRASCVKPASSARSGSDCDASSPTVLGSGDELLDSLMRESEQFRRVATLSRSLCAGVPLVYDRVGSSF
jgi:hypothetical protein